jgi:hypothetical protein
MGEGAAAAAGIFCLLLFAGLIVLVVVLAAYSAKRERERLQRIHDWARHHGWTVTPDPPVGWVSRLPGRERCRVSLAVFGTVAGYRVSVADYSYTTTSTSTSTDSNGHTTTSTSTTTHRFVVTVVLLPRSYPEVAVAARGALSKLGRAMFGDRATAIGHDVFDREFKVVARVPQAVPGLIGPRLVGEHLAGRVPHWSLSGYELLTYRSGTIEDPAEIPVLAEHLIRVARLLPA